MSPSGSFKRFENKAKKKVCLRQQETANPILVFGTALKLHLILNELTQKLLKIVWLFLAFQTTLRGKV